MVHVKLCYLRNKYRNIGTRSSERMLYWYWTAFSITFCGDENQQPVLSIRCNGHCDSGIGFVNTLAQHGSRMDWNSRSSSGLLCEWPLTSCTVGCWNRGIRGLVLGMSMWIWPGDRLVNTMTIRLMQFVYEAQIVCYNGAIGLSLNHWNITCLYVSLKCSSVLEW